MVITALKSALDNILLTGSSSVNLHVYITSINPYYNTLQSYKKHGHA